MPPLTLLAGAEVVLQTLRIAGLGLAGILVFMALFYALIVGLTRLFPQRETPDDPEI